jgi:hypothetical protein
MLGAVLCLVLLYIVGFVDIRSVEYNRAEAKNATSTLAAKVAALIKPVPVLDKVAYDKKMLALANYPVPKAVATASSTASTTPKTASTTPAVKRPWPVTTAPYPLVGALLPDNRILAYYGNFYSKGMGVLGQYSTAEVISKLKNAVAEWTAADPSTPVVPAIEYIAVTAQGSAGADGKYRLRMPDSQIQLAITLAAQVHGIVILDIQAGLSSVQTETPLLDAYLKLPQVHLALDPEFAMHAGAKPGTVVGSLDATDINWAANHLAQLVRDNNLPPKVLVIHRFTQDMVTSYKKITPLPEVQIVMDMDGWGSPAKKIGTYTRVVAPEPVQFTGFKLFYRNDLKPPSTRLMTPAELLTLQPIPSFIQYQ